MDLRSACGICAFCRELMPEDREIMDGIRARWRYPLNHWYIDSDLGDAERVFDAMAMRQVHCKCNPLVHATGYFGGSLRDLWCDYPDLLPPPLQAGCS